jgi:hypothetical protein
VMRLLAVLSGRWRMKVRGSCSASGRNAQSVTIAYDGLNPMPPMFCYLKPYFNGPNKSYFRQAVDGEL